eukprot:761832-Hanusia_phi.AAC.2
MAARSAVAAAGAAAGGEPAALAALGASLPDFPHLPRHLQQQHRGAGRRVARDADQPDSPEPAQQPQGKEDPGRSRSVRQPLVPRRHQLPALVATSRRGAAGMQAYRGVPGEAAASEEGVCPGCQEDQPACSSSGHLGEVHDNGSVSCFQPPHRPPSGHGQHDWPEEAEAGSQPPRAASRLPDVARQPERDRGELQHAEAGAGDGGEDPVVS